MGKNRKTQSAVRLVPALRVLVICFFIGGSGVGYVWQKAQISGLGEQIKQLETRLDDMRRQNKLRADQLAYLRSPRVIDARVRELNLGLLPPQPDQVIRLSETRAEVPAVGKTARRESGQLATISNP
ncbi:MAG TPA: hypothetical protein VK968_19920 [Roseimicrobium sp.]|nr:hypothetical protein [Roseimicrobium sp.]